MRQASLEDAEKLMLNNVKFVGIVLQELRQRNKDLREDMGPTYAKLVGLVTPYEEGVKAMRKVQKELDGCLAVLREKLAEKYKQQARYRRSKKRRF